MSQANRRVLLQRMAALGVGTVAFQRALIAQVASTERITPEMIEQAEWIADVELDAEQRQSVAQAMERALADARRLRKQEIDADTVPALVFRPDFFYAQADEPAAGRSQPVHLRWSRPSKLPKHADQELAFASLSDQAALLAAGKISSRELTALYLARLQRYDPLLHCVVTMLEEPALEQAAASDERRSAGSARGVLDGIPWVAKDLIAVPPWKTTWGGEPFRDQVRPDLATVASRLNEAGAVLLAKVSLGTMAWGDRWFGGLTRSPWQPERGSSGSSAGSASAVAAGLSTFALGSETLGSIVSPCRRCRTSGLRPTFGRVSRAGCMPLAWSMDKIGPIARHVDDLAYVFASLLGPDGKDPTLVERDFRWPVEPQLDQLRVGITGDKLNPMEESARDYLVSRGATLVELDLSSKLPTGAMSFILGVEASTVFDDDFRQAPKADYGRWPSTFRQAQFTPAIQYVRANRLRGQLITETERKLAEVDVVLGGDDLLLTNLTGHPSIIVACGSDTTENGAALPGVVKLTAAAYREETLLHIGSAIQRALPPQPLQPNLDAALQQLTKDAVE